jgi:hypothetical protein
VGHAVNGIGVYGIGANGIGASTTRTLVGIAATFSATEAADSVSAESSLALAAGFAATEAPNTVSASGKLAISGFLIYPGAALTVDLATRAIDGAWASMDATWDSSAAIAAPDTLSAAGIHTATASFNITEITDTASSSAKLAIASASLVSEAPDSITSIASPEASSSLIATEGHDAVSATAKVALSAFLIYPGSALAIDTTTRTIDGAWRSMDATWDASLAAASPDTLVASGILAIKGSFSETETQDSFSSAAKLEIKANLATVAGTPLTIDRADRTIDSAWLTMDITLLDVVPADRPDTLAATGVVPIVGSVAAVIEDTVSARGSLGPREAPALIKPPSRAITMARPALASSAPVTAQIFSSNASPTQPFPKRDRQAVRAFVKSFSKASQITSAGAAGRKVVTN